MKADLDLEFLCGRNFTELLNNRTPQHQNSSTTELLNNRNPQQQNPSTTVKNLKNKFKTCLCPCRAVHKPEEACG
jgi:hypothetical protein